MRVVFKRNVIKTKHVLHVKMIIMDPSAIRNIVALIVEFVRIAEGVIH